MNISVLVLCHFRHLLLGMVLVRLGLGYGYGILVWMIGGLELVNTQVRVMSVIEFGVRILKQGSCCLVEIGQLAIKS